MHVVLVIPERGVISGTATATASPGLSVPGTHQATARYQITAPVSTVVIVSHVGNVTVTGGSGPGVSVTQRVYYSKTPPTTTRTVSGKTLTVTYDCRTQLVCGVAYTLAVPRSVAVRVTAGAGSVRLTGLAGSVTAKADVGLINATGLTSASVSLTTRVGGISASFTAAPTAVQASANVGADHGARARHHVLQGRRRRASGQDHSQRPAERLVRPRHHRDHGHRRHRRRPVALAAGFPCPARRIRAWGGSGRARTR